MSYFQKVGLVLGGLTWLVLSACQAPTSSSTSTSPSTPAEPTVAITGNTLYSDDGGTTNSPASFSFDVPVSATKSLLRAAGTSNQIAITGVIRAGDILLNLKGFYDTVTKQFTFTASGTLGTTRIDITLTGTHVPSSNSITGGTASVAVTTGYGTGTPVTKTYNPPTVATGESSAKPTSTTTGTTTATTIPTSTQKFYEGSWAGSWRIYYSASGESTTPTAYWMDQTYYVTANTVQYTFTLKSVPNAALAATGQTTFVGNDTEVVVEVVSQDPTYFDAYFKSTSTGQFSRVKVYAPQTGYLWGLNYAKADGTTTSASLTAAKAELTTLQSNPPPAGNIGLAKVN